MSEIRISRIEDLLAKFVRILSIPPIMAIAMVFLLWLTRRDLFSSSADFWLCLLFLAAVPVLAYPVSWLVPAFRARGRRGQRTLAFIFAFIGYVFGILYALLYSKTRGLVMLFLIYLFSALILTVFNKMLHIRASGHASSATGPIGYLCTAVGGWFCVLGACLFAVILWASVRIKRHTIPEFLIGSFSCIFSALLAWLICFH